MMSKKEVAAEAFRASVRASNANQKLSASFQKEMIGTNMVPDRFMSGSKGQKAGKLALVA